MSFYDPQTRAEKELLPGIKARTFWGKNLMLAVIDLEAQAILPPHSHPHEQGGILLSGEFTLTIAGETKRIGPGDIYIIPGGKEHSVTVGSEPTQVLDIFSPVREEYKY